MLGFIFFIDCHLSFLFQWTYLYVINQKLSSDCKYDTVGTGLGWSIILLLFKCESDGYILCDLNEQNKS